MSFSILLEYMQIYRAPTPLLSLRSTGRSMRPQLQSRECYAWLHGSRATTGTDSRSRHEKQTLVCRKEGATLLCTSLSVLPQSILVQNRWYRVDRCKQSYQSVTHSHWKHSILCKRFYIRTYQALLHFSNQAYIHQYFTK